MPLNSTCLAQLGLRQSPFESSPEPRFIYDDALLESLIELAQRTLAQSNALVVITGAEGSGRTTQLMRLLGLLPDTTAVIAFRARPNTAFDAVEMTIRHTLRTKSAAPTTEQPLVDLLADRLRNGAAQVLVVDDAQLLVTAAIGQIFQLRRRLIDLVGQAPRLVLVGDHTLTQMKWPALDKRDEERVVYLHLRPLSREQVAAYLRFRLRAAGGADPETLLRRAPLDRLHQGSHGLPAQLNSLAEAWLLELCQAPPPVPAAPPEPPVTSPPPAVTGAAATKLSLWQRLLARLTGRRAAPPSAATSIKADASSPAGNKKTAAVLIPIWQRRWFIPTAVGGIMIIGLVPVFWQWPYSPPPPPHQDGQFAPTPPLVETPATPEPPPPSVTPVATSPMPPPEPPSAEAVTPMPPTPADVPPPAPATTDPPPPAVAPPVTQSDRDWLMAENPNHLTVQLIAAETLATAQGHITPYGLQEVRFISTRARDRNYVIALFGSFPNQAAATQAVNALPARLRQQGYWIRSVGSVQDSLR
ncbi:AAA family ATPase [Thiospirillum jenense]|uniref:AAA family ATPase n=1 Tax=Thiospirillum jenense TaxID=1653858 RepID=UPI0015FDB63D|nr:AAA family ATPase [Thiospirillum jenense]